ncbi:YkgJ family cysteine cluster protein [Fundidesulfovibrio agrisoli]|uniref:YkgJ family cysteine cluster protein n=1 Tax=Fundidesulfovibrio agrisoli TaxID=2922717 RepID=UPI001FABC147|nr:YkgJ family cysteine cluster protein [Fundidesulfovibrio agrisoli]
MNDNDSAFECRRCGHCCLGEGGIVLTVKDQQRLADHLGLELAAFLQAHTTTRGTKVHLGVRADGLCVFFDEGCGIHPARPDICRAWPYFRGNLIDDSSWELALEYCSGINPNVPHQEFVRQGLAALREQGVGVTGDPDAPSALKLDGIEKP